MADRELTRLGRLLEGARRDMLRITTREAARRTRGIVSEGRWRQVVTGIQPIRGRTMPFVPKARVVVAMALAVQVDPAEALDAAGIPASPESVAAMVEDIQRPPEPATGAEEDPLIAEIERIKNLNIPARLRIRMLRALVELAEEEQRDQRHQRGNVA